MSTIYSKTSMVLKNPSVFFEEVRGEKLRHAMKFLAVLSVIPAVCAGIILIAVEFPVMPSVTGAYDANVVAFLLGIVIVIYVYFLYIIGVLLSCLFTHFFAWIFRCKGGLKATTRAVIYGTTPSFLLGALMFVPDIGYLLAILPEIFCVYLTVVGISKQHETSLRKSILVVVLPLSIVLIFTIYYILQYPYVNY